MSWVSLITSMSLPQNTNLPEPSRGFGTLVTLSRDTNRRRSCFSVLTCRVPRQGGLLHSHDLSFWSI